MTNCVRLVTPIGDFPGPRAGITVILCNNFTPLRHRALGTALESKRTPKTMRLLTKLLAAVAVLLLLATPAPAQQPLAFGVLNQQSPALTAERWNPILAYLSATSRVFTNHNFQSDFDAIPFKVLARWAGEPIRAVIAVPADSPIRHLHVQFREIYVSAYPPRWSASAAPCSG